MNAAARLKSHLYRKAIAWIAVNDPLAHGVAVPSALAQAATVRLAAHLWDRPALLVAIDVRNARPSTPGSG